MIVVGGRYSGCTDQSDTRAPCHRKRQTSERIICTLCVRNRQPAYNECSDGASWLKAGSEQTKRAALFRSLTNYVVIIMPHYTPAQGALSDDAV